MATQCGPPAKPISSAVIASVVCISSVRLNVYKILDSRAVVLRIYQQRLTWQLDAESNVSDFIGILRILKHKRQGSFDMDQLTTRYPAQGCLTTQDYAPDTTHTELIKIACSNCSLRELCMPIGMNAQELSRVDELVDRRPAFKRGHTLFRAGEKFTALYAIRSGFFKTTVAAQDGREQVTGFQMAGEIMGLDGVVGEQHTCDATALEDSEVCVLPFDRMEEISREIRALQHHVHKIMSGEIVREHGVMQLLGSLNAEERLAAFLLNLGQRLQARGFSSLNLILRMTREEIGSYLGLTIETVSRTFTKLAELGLITVNQRHIQIVREDALRNIANPHGRD